MRLVSSSSAHADADADVEAANVDANVVADVGGAGGLLFDAGQQLPVRQVVEKCAGATDVAVVVGVVVVVADGVTVVVVVGGGDGVAGGQKGLAKRHHCHRHHAGWDGLKYVVAVAVVLGLLGSAGVGRRIGYVAGARPSGGSAASH